MDCPMLEDKFKRAEDFRSRAHRLRTIANGLARQSERELLMKLAEEYEQVAHSAAAIAKLEVRQATGSDEEIEKQHAARRRDGALDGAQIEGGLS